MKITRKEMPYTDNSELWENETLGASAEHAKPVAADVDAAIDAGLGLEMISIRLQKSLIADLKKYAVTQGITYQPFIRVILTKYIQAQKRKERESQQSAAKTKTYGPKTGRTTRERKEAAAATVTARRGVSKKSSKRAMAAG
jgi:hypothetical protein